MQYALLIYYKPGTNEALGADEYEAVHREYMELKDTPGMFGGRRRADRAASAVSCRCR